ncbi:putative F-box protein At1g49610 [Salvia miltiorrhiza]|uniref:putative F-box protein At1g49610 n=1 Tax=Salvia miltiorrhiza TaxID=226208 RepID=UPI0025AD1E6E|nr:putative F-box protein At1g49610 [Salvia miltiorrhiza]
MSETMDEWHVSQSDEDYGAAEAHSDRLSDLPDSLILTILLLLDMRDVVRTSLLSQRWRNLWSTIPCLDFFEQTPTIISSVLAQWKGPKILKFCLSFPRYIVGPSSVIDSWLLFAIEKHVGELFLYFSYWRDVDSNGKGRYCLPQPLYSCSSITKLTLLSCKLRIEDNVQWNQLKRLEIRYPDGLSGDAMNQVLMGAPRLEELVLCSFEISENFIIQSISLKMLKIETDCVWPQTIVMRIWAPNLLAFKIDASFHGNCLLDAPSLTHAILCLRSKVDEATQFVMFNQFYRSIRHVKKLTLSYSCIQWLLTMKKKDMVVRFPNAELLKHKSICTYFGFLDLLDLLEMFPKLKTLSFHRKRQDDVSMFMSLETTLPRPSLSLLHLHTVDMTWFQRDPSIIPFIGFLLQNSPSLHKMVFRLVNFTDDHEQFLMIQEKILASTKTFQILAAEGAQSTLGTKAGELFRLQHKSRRSRQSKISLTLPDLRCIYPCSELLTFSSSILRATTFLLRKACIADIRFVIHHFPYLLTCSMERQLRPTIYFLQGCFEIRAQKVGGVVC